MKRLVFALMTLAVLAASCSKDSPRKKGENGGGEEVFVANALSINGSEAVTYETGKLSELLSGKTVTSLVWTDISQMNGADVMAIRQAKSSLLSVDMSKVRFIEDETTYDGYTSHQASVKQDMLPENCFSSFSKLETAILPEKVIGIGACAFSGCVKLSSITLPSKLEYTQRYSFHNCGSLESLQLPVTFREVAGSECFVGCTALTSFSFPDATTKVGSDTFDGCSSLKSIHLGASCNVISDYFPGGCYKLETITLSPKNKNMKLENGALLTADGSKLLLQPLYSSDDRLLVKACKTVGMRLVGFPYSVLEYEEGCQEIKTLIVGFSGSGKTIIFPSTVTSIMPGYIANNPGVTKLVVKNPTPPSVSNDFLDGFANLTEILVPSSSVNTYKNAAGWATRSSRIKSI